MLGENYFFRGNDSHPQLPLAFIKDIVLSIVQFGLHNGFSQPGHLDALSPSKGQNISHVFS